MADIFSHAYLTIAATAAANSNEGCIHTFGIPTLIETSFGRARVRLEDPMRTALAQAPLSSRAWVLQEAVLSRRTLHCAKHQLHWECACRLISEDGTTDTEQGSNLFLGHSLACEAH